MYLLSTERLFDNYTTLLKKKTHLKSIYKYFSGTLYFRAEGFLDDNDKNKSSFMKFQYTFLFIILYY